MVRVVKFFFCVPYGVKWWNGGVVEIAGVWCISRQLCVACVCFMGSKILS